MLRELLDNIQCTFTRRYLIALVPDFFFNPTAATDIYPLSLHDALPIWTAAGNPGILRAVLAFGGWNIGDKREHGAKDRSEEHTSELQSRFDLVCRLLLEKKKTPTTP